MSQAGSLLAGGGSGPVTGILSLTGNNPVAVFGDIANNIDLLGSGPVTVTGTAITNSLAISVAGATTLVTGVVQLATDAETIAGTVSTKAVTPTSLKAKLGAQTQFGVAVGETTTGAVQWSNAGTNGQLLIAGTGVNPAFATLESADNSVTISSPGANRLNLAVNAGMTTAPILITTFNTPGSTTWTPDANAKMVCITIVSGGGGGGSGACGNSGAASGGGAGGPGHFFQGTLPASYFSGIQTVVVGAAGVGGASVNAAIPTVGNPGTSGGQSAIGNIVMPLSNGITNSNNGGGGGTASPGTGGNFSQAVGMLYNAFFIGQANSAVFGGQAGSFTGYPAIPSGGNRGLFMSTSGGGGGAGANSGTAYRGGATQNSNLNLSYNSVAAIGGIETGTIDGDSGAGFVTSNGFIDWGVAGAGGGGQSIGTRGGNGGNAGGFGAGGGGGGGSLLNSASGAGGNAAPGFVQIIEYF